MIAASTPSADRHSSISANLTTSQHQHTSTTTTARLATPAPFLHLTPHYRYNTHVAPAAWRTAIHLGTRTDKRWVPANNSSDCERECELTARAQRSHAQMQEQERSASPAWSSSLHPNQNPQNPSRAHLHSQICPSYHGGRAPLDRRFFARRSSSDSPRHISHHLPDSAPAVHPESMASSARPRRYAGDGFDYRRPAGFRREQDTPPLDLSEEDDAHVDLSRDEDVIDLTADDSGYGASQDNAEDQRRTRPPPRLPRGMDIVINLDNGDEEWAPAAQRPGSPEIEFISSRPLPPRDGEEVQFVRSQALSAEEQTRRRNEELDRALNLIGANDLGNRFTHLQAQINRFHSNIHRTAESIRRTRTPVVPPRARGMVHVGFAPPGLLDFGVAAFDLGNGGQHRPAPVPTYSAPPDAPEGFTRSPQEEGELVCPNCEEELCVGGDDQKKQVWIVKACGHVSSTLLENVCDGANLEVRSTAASVRHIALPSAVPRARRNPRGRSRSRSVWLRGATRELRIPRLCCKSTCRRLVTIPSMYNVRCLLACMARHDMTYARHSSWCWEFLLFFWAWVERQHVSYLCTTYHEYI